MSVADDLARYQQAVGNAEKWRSLLQDAYRYALPNRELFYDHERGQSRQSEVYDNTAVHGVQTFASRVQALLMPPWRQWMKLVPGPGIAEEHQSAAGEALEPINETLFRHIHASNLDMAAHEAIQDMAVSIGALLFEQGDRSIGEPLFRITAIPTPMLAVEEGVDGKLDGCWRRVTLPVRAVQATWQDAKLPQQLEHLLQSSPNEPVHLVEGTIPVTGKRGLWRYVVIHEGSKAHLVEREREDFPWILFRWSKTPGELFGRGPVLSVLPEIRVLNRADEFRLRAAALAIGGIYTARNDGVLNPYLVRLVPNTIIPVASNDNSNPSIRALEQAGLPDMAQLFMEERRERVRQALLTQPFGEIDSPVKSATEISLRAQELNQQVGAQFGRLQSELVKPFVDRALAIMANVGEIDEEIRIDGALVEIQQQSPLARMQDQEDLAQMIQYFEIVGSLGPDVLMGSADLFEFADQVGEKLGIDFKIRRDEAERAAYQDDMRNRIAQAMAQEQMKAQQQEAKSRAV